MTLEGMIAEARAERDAALAAIERVRAIHLNAGPSQGYGSQFKGGYGMLGDCCESCGSHGEYGVEWPCPTIQALDGAPEPEEVEWEYRCDIRKHFWVTHGVHHDCEGNPERRRKAGPWVPVEGESK